jgi:UDP-GlcNAc:undecaprenyl-phosphate GlcNAc-1-phosphate transferase
MTGTLHYRVIDLSIAVLPPPPFPHPRRMTDFAWIPIAAVTAALVGAAVIRTLLGERFATFGLDRPNDRSMHTRPVPRTGGLGILAGFVVACMLVGPGLPWPLWAGLAMLVAVSVIDDLRSLSAAIRLPLHLVAAGVALTPALSTADPLAFALATLAAGWMVNLYNFMDGSDALAGSQALFGFGAIAAAALAGGDSGLALAAVAVAGAAAGFLLFNAPPARIFMGDAGSTALGLLAAAFGALGTARGLWSPWFPVIAFLPFVFDASATLAMRAARGAKVWEAHREHAYQRLNMGGFGHRNTALLYAGLMAACAVVAVLVRDDGRAALVVLLVVSAALYHRVQRTWSRRPAGPKAP